MTATYHPCAWFALCENDAVGSIEHAVLGPVAICQRCYDIVARQVSLLPGGTTVQPPPKLSLYCAYEDCTTGEPPADQGRYPELCLNCYYEALADDAANYERGDR